MLIFFSKPNTPFLYLNLSVLGCNSYKCIYLYFKLDIQKEKTQINTKDYENTKEKTKYIH